MKPRMSDTPPHVQEILIRGYRSMSPKQKMKRVSELNKTVLLLARARIRKQYAGVPKREQDLRLGALWLGREKMIQVFGWDPDKEGR